MTCDFCKEHDNDLVWDDLHERFTQSYYEPTAMFLCKTCAKINDSFWRFTSLEMTIAMERQMNNRAFNRMRKEVLA